MSADVPPHGGRLVNRAVRPEEREARIVEARELPRIRLDAEQVTNVRNLAHGAYSPLEGFMTREDYGSVLAASRLASGVPWTIPIVLDVPRDQEGFRVGDDVALEGPAGAIAGTIRVEDVYPWDREEHARRVFGTTSPEHPGVARLNARGDRLVGGRITILDDSRGPFADASLTPREARDLFGERGWRTVAGYQTRNPPHRAHEFLHKLVLGLVDGVLVHPVVGRKKRGDFRDEVIIDAYRALLAEYYPRDRVALGALPYEMQYAGPNEAILHAIVRKNFGCTHFIVGRDHAGVGSFYAPDAAIERFDDFPDLGIEPIAIRGDHHWCRVCLGLESERTCPHPREAHVPVSGTLIRELLASGREAPPEIVRPEVLAAIRKHARPFVD